MDTIVERDHHLHIAGRRWVVPEVRLTALPRGRTGLSQPEIDRVHRAVANHICGSADRLTAAAFEFLCDTADVPYLRVATALSLDRSTFTKWMGTGRPMRDERSGLVKRWFLDRLFGDRVGRVPAHVAAHNTAFLLWFSDRVVRRGLAMPVRELGCDAAPPPPPLELPGTSGQLPEIAVTWREVA